MVLFEASYSMGGSVWKHPKTALPRKVLKKDFEVVLNSPIKIRWGKVLGRDFSLSDLLEDYDAVYLGIGTGFTWSEHLEKDESGRVKAHPVTFQTGRPGVFAGGSLLPGVGRRSPIQSISDGQRAAISIDRYLRKLSLPTRLENEASFDTTQYPENSNVLQNEGSQADRPIQEYSSQRSTGQCGAHLYTRHRADH